MMNNVVKTNKMTDFFNSFADVLSSDITRNLSRNFSSNFTRNRTMTFRDVILYFVFRNSKDTNTDLTKYFCSTDRLEKRITKQALNVDIKKLNPSVFRYLFKEFAKEFYQSKLPKTYKGYTLLAEDGTFLEIPYSIHNIYNFGFWKNQYVKDIFDVKKVLSKSAGLYDVTNGIFLDFMMRPAPYSEIPLAFQHLYSCGDLLAGKKVIYLADRYYGSVELISHLEHLGFDYCIRAKSNFFKKQVSEMTSNDEWIEVDVDRLWRKRFRFSDEARKIREDNPKVKIRVVKFTYAYSNKFGESIESDITYFTSLSKEEFSHEDIIELYSKRWNIEVAYKTLKTDMELERHVSESDTVSQCCIYGKIVLYNILGVIRKEIDRYLSRHPGKHRRRPNREETSDKNDEDNIQYRVNIKQLHNLLMENNLLYPFYSHKKTLMRKRIKQIVAVAQTIKVPVRKNRHSQRWGRVVPSGFYYRFSLDGRNYPKIQTIKGVMRTVAP